MGSKLDNNNQSTDRRLGAIFLIVGWLIVIMLVGMLINKTMFGVKRASVITTPTGTQVTIPLGYDSHFHIHGNINDTPVTFLIDTGASSVVVSSSLARKANLEKTTQINTLTANGEAVGYLTNIERLEFGGIEITNVSAIIIDNMPAAEALLGMNVLKRFTTQQTKDSLILTVPAVAH